MQACAIYHSSAERQGRGSGNVTCIARASSPATGNNVPTIAIWPLALPVEQVGAQVLPARVSRAPRCYVLVVGFVVELQEPARELQVRQ